MIPTKNVDRLYHVATELVFIFLRSSVNPFLFCFLSFPVCWKSFSAGSVFRTLGNSLIHRTVSVLPSFSKVLEAVIYSEFVNHLTSQGLHSDKQSGFRFSNSIADWTTVKTERICQALQRNSATPAVIILDIAKAFNRV